jgi:antitoxin (DNA-binding transcriptional repressor) of toxin-antitoxin stability system
MTMQMIPVEEAQAQLAEILTKLVPGEEVVLTRDAEPAATIRCITPLSPPAQDAPQGSPAKLAMQTTPVAQAQGHLREIVVKLSPGDEVVLTAGGKLIATIRPPQAVPREPPRLGTMRGTVLSIAPAFDDIPEGFEAYLP